MPPRALPPAAAACGRAFGMLDRDGRSPLICAIEARSADVVALLFVWRCGNCCDGGAAVHCAAAAAAAGSNNTNGMHKKVWKGPTNSSSSHNYSAPPCCSRAHRVGRNGAGPVGPGCSTASFTTAGYEWATTLCCCCSCCLGESWAVQPGQRPAGSDVTFFRRGGGAQRYGAGFGGCGGQAACRVRAGGVPPVCGCVGLRCGVPSDHDGRLCRRLKCIAHREAEGVSFAGMFRGLFR